MGRPVGVWTRAQRRVREPQPWGCRYRDSEAVFAAVRPILPAKEQDDVASQLAWDLERLWRSTSA
jgi:hypothetical protein